MEHEHKMAGDEEDWGREGASDTLLPPKGGKLQKGEGFLPLHGGCSKQVMGQTLGIELWLLQSNHLKQIRSPNKVFHTYSCIPNIQYFQI